MSDKVEFELEYIINVSPKILYNCLSTPSGLSEWFADDVNIHGDEYTFFWDGSEEVAKVLAQKPTEYVKFRWEEDEGENYYFKLAIKIDPLTKDVALVITDFADPEEQEEAVLLWDKQIETLRQSIGG